MLLKRNTFPYLLFFLVIVSSCQSDRTSIKLEQFKNTYVAHTMLSNANDVAIVATVVADSLDVPWEITWGPDGWIWFTEQKGRVYRLNPETGEKQELLTITDLIYQKSRGLSGMILHPDFEANPYVYLIYQYYPKDSVTSSKVVRYRFEAGTLKNPFILLENIPGATYHNGARLMITPDLKLLVTTGDAGNVNNSQNTNNLSGKILRINLDGSIPADNPFPDNPVWSWGHRNAQGLVWADNGKIYSSEHGADNDDELNPIYKGRNYGWPDVMGYCDLPSEKTYCADSNIVEPLIAWSPTIAPSGLTYYHHSAIPEWDNSLILGSLKDQTLRVLQLNEAGDEIISEKELFRNRFGRIRDVCVSPDGAVYLSTSNLDWHPKHFSNVYENLPLDAGDQIIRLTKAGEDQLAWLKTLPEQEKSILQDTLLAAVSEELETPGATIYNQYCSGCHQLDGQGIAGLYPPLAQSEWVLEDKERLLDVLLNGLYGPIKVRGKSYDHQMPPYRFLSDQQLADVLTYIRQSFGNNADPVAPEEISAARTAL